MTTRKHAIRNRLRRLLASLFDEPIERVTLEFVGTTLRVETVGFVDTRDETKSPHVNREDALLGDQYAPRLFLILDQWCRALRHNSVEEVQAMEGELEGAINGFFFKPVPLEKDTQRPARLALKRAINMVLDNAGDRRMVALQNQANLDNLTTAYRMWRWDTPLIPHNISYLMEALEHARERRDKNHPFWRVGGQGHTALKRARKWLKENDG